MTNKLKGNTSSWRYSQRRHLITVVGLLIIAIILLSAFSSFALNRFEQASKQEEQAIQDFQALIGHTRKAEIHFRLQVQEWKNILLRGHVQKDYDKYHSAFNKRLGDVALHLNEIIMLANTIGLDVDEVTEVLTIHSVLNESYAEAVVHLDKDIPLSYRDVDRMVRGKDRPFLIAFEELNEKIFNLAESNRDNAHENLLEKSAAVGNVIVVFAGISFLLAGFTLIIALRVISNR